MSIIVYSSQNAPLIKISLPLPNTLDISHLELSTDAYYIPNLVFNNIISVSGGKHIQGEISIDSKIVFNEYLKNINPNEIDNVVHDEFMVKFINAIFYVLAEKSELTKKAMVEKYMQTMTIHHMTMSTIQMINGQLPPIPPSIAPSVVPPSNMMAFNMMPSMSIQQQGAGFINPNFNLDFIDSPGPNKSTERQRKDSELSGGSYVSSNQSSDESEDVSTQNENKKT